MVARLLGSRLLLAFALTAPLLWAVARLLSGNPTVQADPLKYLLHHTGYTASLLLLCTLLLSPLLVLSRRASWTVSLHRHRKALGLASFGYAALHLTVHLLYEGRFSILVSDWEKPFLATGMVAWVLLALLAVTSLTALRRALGPVAWKWIHRSIYPAAALVCYHQVAARKITPVEVLWLFGGLAVLEALRWLRPLRSPRSQRCADTTPT
jgi:methionine sulfoxide reductase heme-binding subunit